MINYKDLEGKIKTIRTITKKSSNLIQREESGIIVSCKEVNKSNKLQYKIDGISLTGKSFIIYVDETSEIIDLELDKIKRNCLHEIRNAILRKKEAQKIIETEKANIENLTIALLSDLNAINQETFVENISKDLKNLEIENKMSFQYRNGYADITISTANASFYIWVKKHNIEHIKITPKNSISLENSNIKIEDYKNKKNLQNTIEKEYKLNDCFPNKYYSLIENNNLFIKDYSTVNLNKDNQLEYILYHIIYSENKEIFLNNNTIQLIMELIKVVSMCKFPC